MIGKFQLARTEPVIMATFSVRINKLKIFLKSLELRVHKLLRFGELDLDGNLSIAMKWIKQICLGGRVCV